MRLYLSVDMEGITGLPDFRFVRATENHYARGSRIMTEEANAIISEAFAQGVDYLLVNDSHSTMTNIIIEELHPDAEIITGGSKPFSMVQSLDRTFSGAIFAGYHARAGQPGVMSHTITLNIRNIYVDDVLVGEIGLNAYVAGYYGVPVIMIAGDDKACAEAKQLMPHIVTAPVKQHVTRASTKSLTPTKAKQLLQEKVKTAIQSFDQMEPLTPPDHPTIRVEFANYGQAEYASLIPRSKIEEGTTIVRFEAENIVEAYRTIVAMATLAGHATY
ncbi:MAG TPA: M55 family metallopeptidase [Bacillota bacterium]|nr:M55 family metallopeptidase [Bacillota bacterium]